MPLKAEYVPSARKNALFMSVMMGISGPLGFGGFALVAIDWPYSLIVNILALGLFASMSYWGIMFGVRYWRHFKDIGIMLRQRSIALIIDAHGLWQHSNTDENPIPWDCVEEVRAGSSHGVHYLEVKVKKDRVPELRGLSPDAASSALRIVAENYTCSMEDIEAEMFKYWPAQ